MLTRERRFNESLFNGASCLFIIKSGAVFAVPLSPRDPTPKNYCVSNNKPNGTVYFMMRLPFNFLLRKLIIRYREIIGCVTNGAIRIISLFRFVMNDLRIDSSR